jgi:hypothetical protein
MSEFRGVPGLKDSDKIVALLVALSVITPFVMIGLYLFPRALPWWMDGGDWLKRVNAILGNAYPMWNQGTLQYPPLFMILVAGLSKILGEILALKVMALVSFSLIPLTTYFFVNELFHDKVVGVAAAWAAAFTPIWFEMIGWGGYPDLLGLAVLPFAFYGIVRYNRDKSSKSMLMLALGSALVPLTHHLTFLTFAGVLGLWTMLAAVYDRPSLRGIALAIGVTAGVFLAYRFIAGPSQFILFNEAALVYLQPNASTLLYMFKSYLYLSILYITALVTATYLLVDKSHRGKALLLVSWMAIPIVFSQGYLLGVSLDYNRILFFFSQPLMMIVAAPLMFRNDVWNLVRGRNLGSKISEAAGFLKPGTVTGSRSAKQFLAAGILVLSLVSVFSTPIIGANTMYNVNSWYNGVDVYGDQDKVQVANYLSTHTSPTAVVVAETTMARWIEGLAQRRVLLEEGPQYLFIQGELAREYAANAIYFSHQGERNGYAWVLDQAPYGSLSPLVSFYHQGAYYSTAYLNETKSYVSWVDRGTGTNFTLPLVNATARSVSFGVRTSDLASIVENYTLGPITVQRQVYMGVDNRVVNFTFQATTTDPRVELTKLAIDLKPVSSLGLYQASVVANRTLQITTTMGNIFFSSTSTNAFPFTFASTQQAGSLSGSISVWGDSPGNSTGLFTYTRAELLSAYGVTDVVIPKYPFVAVGTTVQTTIQVPQGYRYLLSDPQFKIVFSVSHALVLGVQS